MITIDSRLPLLMIAAIVLLSSGLSYLQGRRNGVMVVIILPIDLLFTIIGFVLGMASLRWGNVWPWIFFSISAGGAVPWLCYLAGRAGQNDSDRKRKYQYVDSSGPPPTDP